MRPHDGAVGHGVFVVRIGRQKLEHPLPDAALGPAREADVDLDRIAEPLGQIPPRGAGSVPIEHRFREQRRLFLTITPT